MQSCMHIKEEARVAMHLAHHWAGCEGATPLLFGAGHGAPWGWEEDWQLRCALSCGACSLACCATVWDALVSPKKEGADLPCKQGK
jgi:hypothetical protein